MKTSELVFIGIKGSVVALNHATGKQVWATHLKGSGFVNAVVERDRVFAICCGEVFCIDALTGDALWHNPLKGFGIGLATIATDAPARDNLTAVLAEQRRCDEEAAAAT